jgi:hypothetical protein
MGKKRAPKYIRDRREPKPPKPNKPSTRWWKVLLEIFLLLCAVLGLVSAILTFSPKLSLDTSGTLRPRDPIGTVFYLTNVGSVTVYDVIADCGMDDLKFGNNSEISGITMRMPESKADQLSPGHKMTLGCQRTIESGDDVHEAKMTILVSYRPPYVWWRRKEQFPVEAERTQNGEWTWKSLPQ